MPSLSITTAQVAAFHAASHDANPLHLDRTYAQRSQFGQPVVYGMAAVLRALAIWGGGKPLRMVKLRADFRKPLYVNETYELRSDCTAQGQRLRIGKGPVDYAVIQVLVENWTPTDMPADDAGYPGFVPREFAAEEPEMGARRMGYDVPADALAALNREFDLSPRALPASQVASLLWASYHVGMEMPGRQALFADIRIDYADPSPDIAKLSLALRAASHDERFNRYSQSGSGTGMTQFTVGAFRRPAPVDYPLATLPRFDAPLPLAGKTVFVSGAARGFGAVAARTCMLAGARVAINYRGDAAAAAQLRDELLAAGGTAQCFAADLEDARAVSELAHSLHAAWGPLDMIIDNAAPPIRELQFLEQQDIEWMDFVRRNLAITQNTARHLLPLLVEDGRFVHISSKYLLEPARGFSHYLAAKSAQGALVGALALEFTALQFVVARLPRILTDQTNLPFSFDAPRDPATVAHELLLRLPQAAPGNCRIIDLF